ncbi:MAG: hypothetical protein JW943_08200, partial [Deltaproteobacteria bacterium]|nr:hypothetical protein [Deltaproteobacteria bacterium]
MKTRDEIITELRKVLKAKAVNEEDKVKATKITDLVNCLYVLTDVLCDALMKEDKTMKENSLELLVGMVNNLKRNFINLKETEGNIIDTSSKKERPFASREKIEEEGKIGEN